MQLPDTRVKAIRYQCGTISCVLLENDSPIRTMRSFKPLACWRCASVSHKFPG
jgi:hypothetical protein